MQGKLALITGGSKGIGFAIAEALLGKGAYAMICSRQTEDVTEAVEKLRISYGDKISGVHCDIRSYKQVQEMFKVIDEQFGRLDVLINNAGVGSFHKVEEIDIEEWNRTIETNLSGVFYCCKEAIPLMKKRGGGYIINIGSLAGKEAFAGASAYCASKFGLVGFSDALMQEVRNDHIKVSTIMPGSVNTTFSRSGKEDPATTWKLFPEDVARVVINLLEMEPRALPSRVELRASEPRK